MKQRVFTKKNILIYLLTMAVALVITLVIVLTRGGGTAIGYIKDQTTTSGLGYDYYVPNTYRSFRKTPLIVMLHGGHQTAEDIALATKMNQMSNYYGFIVLYPEQSSDNNSSLYWNWFLDENQQRDGTEVALIIDAVNAIKDQYSIADDEVYVAGLSAGAAMALNMAILYPDVFSGVAMASGIGFGVAQNAVQAYSAMSGYLPDPEEKALLAYQRMPEDSRHMIRLILTQGTDDDRVDAANAAFITEEIAILNDWIDDGMRNNSFSDVPWDAIGDETNSGVTFVKNTYVQNDMTYISEYLIEGMGHAWPGGDSEASYTAPDAPDLSQLMIDFFLSGRH